MNRSRGISTTATSIAIGFIVVVFAIGGYFIFKYLSVDPVIRSVNQTLKLEHGITSETHTVNILESDEVYFRGIVTTKDGGDSQTMVGKYEKGYATFFYFGNESPTCQLKEIYSVPENILGNCKKYGGSGISVGEAKEKLLDDEEESFTIVGFISFGNDPSQGKATINSGDDTISLPLSNPQQVDRVNDNDIVEVDIIETDGIIEVGNIDPIDSGNDSEDSEEDSQSEVSNEPFSKPPPEFYYNIYDLNQAELLRLLND